MSSTAAPTLVSGRQQIADWVMMSLTFIVASSLLRLAKLSGKPLALLAPDRFESRAIGDHEGGTLQRHELPAFELAKRPRDGFPRCADEFGDLFVGQRQLDRRTLLCVLRLGGPIEKQAGKFFGSGSRETNGPQLLAGPVVECAELLHDSLVCFSVLDDEAQEIVAANEHYLARMQGLGGDLVRTTRHDRHEAE